MVNQEAREATTPGPALKLFSGAGNEDLLVDLLNSILRPAKQQRICQVKVINPIKDRDFADDKLAVMDLVAQVDDGTLFTIEIQVANEHEMEKRALYYWSNIFISQARMGMEYKNLRKTISINILDYLLWPNTNKYHTVFQPLEKTEGFLLTDVAEIRFIELPKMYRKWKGGSLRSNSDPLIKWFLLLMVTEDEKIIKELEEIAMTDGLIKKAMNEWERLSQDPGTRAIYRSRMLAKMDQLSALKAAENRGKEEGRAEGKAEGEYFKALAVARMALREGITPELIAKITGLDQATIRKLREELTP
ncbi:MAG: Rpn family recombination-promoting nuclease/putative transposase [Heliobacteriaceae bacterium]|nr:Rpn family recombination-promoting nuclease/putative transposase [Heliobacteriaceae bacterium]